MAENKNIELYEINATDLSGLNSLKAKDLIVSCFFHAQKETLARAKQKLGNESNDDTLRKSIIIIIKQALKDCGGSYEVPSNACLNAIVPVLAKKAISWGTPKDIVNHHKEQIQKMLKLLEE